MGIFKRLFGEKETDAADDIPPRQAFFRPMSDRIMEAAALGFQNPDSGTKFDDGLFQMLDAKTELDLPSHVHQKLQRLSFLLWKKNVRAFGGVELALDFCLGNGIKIKTRDRKVAELLDRHWRVNQWPFMIRERFRTILIFGELLWPVWVGENGFVKLTSVDPLKIWRIDRNKENAEDLEFVQTTIGGEFGSSENIPDATAPKKIGRRFRIIKPTMEGNLEDDKGESDQLGFFFVINRIAGATRGQPDYGAAIDWLEGLDGFTMTLLERASLAMQMVHDFEYKGLDEKKLRVKGKEVARDLHPGGIWVHNESAKLTLHAPNIGASEAAETTRVLLKHIQAGMRVPAMGFGDSEDLTRAAAAELSVPMQRAIQGKQMHLRMMIEEVLTFQVEQAQKHNALQGVQDFSFEVVMPPIFLRDLTTVTAALAQLTGALNEGVIAKYITEDQAGTVYRIALSQIADVVDKGIGVDEQTVAEGIANIARENPDLAPALAKLHPRFAEALEEHFGENGDGNGSNGDT